MAKIMTRTFSMALPEIMDQPTMAKTICSMDSQMPPSQTQMIINQQQDYVFLASEGAITWKLKRQTIIAMSSTESEYVALSEARQEAFWLRNLYNELGFPQMGPTVIKSNNEGSVILSHNIQFHARTKHIEICHHWVRDLVNDKFLDVQSCRNPSRQADILTKPLPNRNTKDIDVEMGNGFVNISAVCSGCGNSVHQGICHWLSLWPSGGHISMCFVRAWNWILWDKNNWTLIVALMTVGPICGKPSSLYKFLSQKASCLASESANIFRFCRGHCDNCLSL